MRTAYLSELYNLASQDENVLALVADNGAIVYDEYREAFPDRFINFGIAEANMVSVAGGLASCGKKPFCYTIANFITMRAFEQIRNDICLQNANVKLVGIGAGFIYSDLGPSHHSIEDISLMRVLPGITIFSPASPLETRKITKAMYEIDGPVYLRLASSGTPELYEHDYDFEVGKAVVLRAGTDITIISTGNIVHEVLRAAEELEKLGISTKVINIHTIKPFDSGAVVKAARETGGILTVEEHSIYGGLGSVVAEALAENMICTKFKRLGLADTFPSGYGSYDEMKKMNGLSMEHIVEEAVKLRG